MAAKRSTERHRRFRGGGGRRITPLDRWDGCSSQKKTSSASELEAPVADQSPAFVATLCSLFLCDRMQTTNKARTGRQRRFAVLWPSSSSSCKIIEFLMPGLSVLRLHISRSLITATENPNLQTATSVKDRMSSKAQQHHKGAITSCLLRSLATVSQDVHLSSASSSAAGGLLPAPTSECLHSDCPDGRSSNHTAIASNITDIPD